MLLSISANVEAKILFKPQGTDTPDLQRWSKRRRVGFWKVVDTFATLSATTLIYESNGKDFWVLNPSCPVFCLSVEEGQGQVGLSPVCYQALSNQYHTPAPASSNWHVGYNDRYSSPEIVPTHKSKHWDKMPEWWGCTSLFNTMWNNIQHLELWLPCHILMASWGGSLMLCNFKHWQDEAHLCYWVWTCQPSCC